MEGYLNTELYDGNLNQKENSDNSILFYKYTGLAYGRMRVESVVQENEWQLGFLTRRVLQ